jgi:hypothetical protein
MLGVRVVKRGGRLLSKQKTALFQEFHGSSTVVYGFLMRVIHSFAARSCFDKLSTNGEFLPSVVFAVRPEPVEGRLSMDNHQAETVVVVWNGPCASINTFRQSEAMRRERMLAIDDLRNYSAHAMLRDGTPVYIRAIRPDDKERLADHFARLTAESRYYRFFGFRKALTPHELGYLTEPNFAGHVALVATIKKGNSVESIVGDGRYVALPGDARRLAFLRELGLALDVFKHGLMQGEGRLQELFELPWSSQGRKLLEYLVYVFAYSRVTDEQAVIGVEAGGAGMIVARPKVHVAAQLLIFPPYHQDHLGMGLVPHYTVNHMRPGLLKVIGQFDIGLLLKPGA